ncbi:MAG TPA: caspase family protein [Bacteroidales bacterium]|nr:caspase family protein [Bacteroidales bacterium]HQC59930.1 caspase family protein [Bacteroidales bacterium]
MGRKALVIGIDNYESAPLRACVNDANCVAELLEKHEDGTKNFDVNFLLNDEATRANIRSGIRKLFKNNDDIALLYFSGHGIDDDNDGFIVSHDYKHDDYGISMPEIMRFVNRSKCKNKIVIFDCCYSGLIANSGMIGDSSIISDGTIVLTASRKDEESYINAGEPNSVFTKLFAMALNGAASDMFGYTSPSSIYSFIDKALGPWEQRPIFKSNVDSFISLRQNAPNITTRELKRITKYFEDKTSKMKLDPSFEPTNYFGSKDRTKEPYCVEENSKIFGDLLLYYKNGLVTPIEEKNMYETAMNFKNCELTKLGQYYHDLVKTNRI